MKVAFGFINNAGSAFVYSNALIKAGCTVKCFFLSDEGFGHLHPIDNTITFSYYTSLHDVVSEIILHKYDIFVNLASTGGNLFALEEAYKKLKSHNVKIATIHLGSDSRLSPISTTIYYIKSLIGSSFDMFPNAMAQDVYLRASFVNLAERYSDIIIDNPFSWHLHKKHYINWHYMGKPCDCYSSLQTTLSNYESKAKYHLNSDRTFRIMHIPSNRRTKGSRYIDSVMKRLQSIPSSPYSINYSRPSSLISHAEVIDQLDNTDILIDQVYSDLPISAITAEALGRGVFVLELGQYLAYPSAWASSNVDYPTFIGRPDCLETLLLNLLYQLKHASSDGFLHAFHTWNSFYSSDQIGTRLHQLFLGSRDQDYSLIFSDWLVDPLCSHYTEVSFHPEHVFARLSSLGLYSESIDMLQSLGYERASDALSILQERLQLQYP